MVRIVQSITGRDLMRVRDTRTRGVHVKEVLESMTLCAVYSEEELTAFKPEPGDRLCVSCFDRLAERRAAA